MSHTVEIKSMGSAFDNAHRALLRKRGRTTTRSLALLAWGEEYNCNVNFQANWGNWKSIEFNSEEDYLMFILKWA